MLLEAKNLLNLNQKELGVYCGVSARTVNTWMTGEKTCRDYVAEMVLRLAKVDSKALEYGEPTTNMMRWALISSYGSDEWLTVCGSKTDALRLADEEWKHMTESERQREEKFLVGLVNVQLNDGLECDSRFTYSEIEGRIDSDIYEILKDYKGDTAE